MTVDIKVKGKPSKPKGPLEISDVFEDRATLDWKPPGTVGLLIFQIVSRSLIL